MTTRFALLAVFSVMAAGCGGNGSTTVAAPSTGSSGSTTGSSVSVVSGASVLTTTAYSPNPLTVSRGTAVTFANNDSTAHTATSSGTFDTGVIAPGGRATVTLQNAGTVSYRCSIHPNMTGTIVVQ